jgi:transposase
LSRDLSSASESAPGPMCRWNDGKKSLRRGIDKRRMECTLRPMAKGFLPYSLDQRLLLPPDMRAWLPEGHLALFVSDIVEELDLSEIYAAYAGKDDRGRAGYHPTMMTKLLVYGYCVGTRSSRRMERATHEEVAFRVLSGDQHPDHDCIAAFRQLHLKTLRGLFLQVLRLCQKAGLVKLGHVSIDGTKVGANASKHKAMSYGRMSEAEKRLEEEVARLLEEAERIDAEEDARYGKSKRGDELPEELQRRESRLKKIREAKTELEADAKAKAGAQATEANAKLEERAKKEAETGKKMSGKPPAVPDPETAKPDPKAQRNFTDPESRIMPDGANKGSFIQGYNAQIAVDAEAQIIVATEVLQEPNDKQQLVPMTEQVKQNVGRVPDVTSADAGYFAEHAIETLEQMGTNVLVPPHRQKHGEQAEAAQPLAQRASTTDWMRYKLLTPLARALYRMRKAIVEPVFGQIKDPRGIRRFLLRGLAKVRAEFDLIALTHNLLKLFRRAPHAIARRAPT